MKHFLIMLLSALCLTASAQTEQPMQTSTHARTMTLKPIFGYVSYGEVMKHMREYTVLQAKLDTIRAHHQQELRNAEKEFGEKYELFLDQQSTMDKAIREKRQSELQAMLEKNSEFRTRSKVILQQTEEEGMNAIREKLNAVIKTVGMAKQLVAVINTDNDNCPFLNPDLTTDVTKDVMAKLK